jgi:hypothetical protein
MASNSRRCSNSSTISSAAAAKGSRRARIAAGERTFAQDGTRAVVQRRIRFQHEGGQPRGTFAMEVLDADAAGRRERRPVVEHRLDLRVPRGGVHAEAGEAHDRSRLAQRVLRGVGVLEVGCVERVEVAIWDWHAAPIPA